MFFLAYLAAFFGQLHITRNYVFTGNTSAEQLPLQSKQFDTTVSQQLLLQSSYFYGAATFPKHLFLLSSSLSKQLLIRSKTSTDQLLLLENREFLRAASFSEQLLFRKTNLLRISIPTEEFLFRSTHFYKHQIFQSNFFFNEVSSYFRKKIFFFRRSNRT